MRARPGPGPGPGRDPAGFVGASSNGGQCCRDVARRRTSRPGPAGTTGPTGFGMAGDIPRRRATAHLRSGLAGTTGPAGEVRPGWPDMPRHRPAPHLPSRLAGATDSTGSVPPWWPDIARRARRLTSRPGPAGAASSAEGVLPRRPDRQTETPHHGPPPPKPAGATDSTEGLPPQQPDIPGRHATAHLLPGRALRSAATPLPSAARPGHSARHPPLPGPARRTSQRPPRIPGDGRCQVRDFSQLVRR